jgi:hypothetical protein
MVLVANTGEASVSSTPQATPDPKPSLPNPTSALIDYLAAQRGHPAPSLRLRQTSPLPLELERELGAGPSRVGAVRYQKKQKPERGRMV